MNVARPRNRTCDLPNASQDTLPTAQSGPAFYHRVIPTKYVDDIANSEDPDQEQSDLGLQCLLRPICSKTSVNYSKKAAKQVHVKPGITQNKQSNIQEAI